MISILLSKNTFFCPVNYSLNILTPSTKLSAEKVIVVIFKPCSMRTAEDDILVKKEIESTLCATGKGHVLYVEDDERKVKSQRIIDIREKIIKLMPSLKSQCYPNDSIPRSDSQHSSDVTERTVHNTLKSCTPVHPLQHIAGHGAYRKYAY